MRSLRYKLKLLYCGPERKLQKELKWNIKMFWHILGLVLRLGLATPIIDL